MSTTGVRGGPPRPRQPRLRPYEMEALVVIAALALMFMGGGALVGWVLANQNEGHPNAAKPVQRGAEPTATVGEDSGAGSGGSSGSQPAGSDTGATSTEGAATTAETTTEAATTDTSTAPADGNAQLADGKKVFETQGCSGCHTLADAGASGNVGPNLDEAKPDKALVIDRVTNGKGVMPPFKGQLSDAQIQAVAGYVSTVAGRG